MTTVARLAAVLTADTSTFETGMRRASKQITETERNFNRELKRMGVSFDGLGKKVAQFGGVLAAGLSAAKVVGDLRTIINEMDRVGDMSVRLGIATESLSKMAYAASRAGIGIDELEKTISNMQLAIVRSNEGLKNYQRAFTRIGVDWQKLQKLSPEQQFIQLAKTLASIEDPIKRNSAAILLFGGAGLRVVEMVKEGKVPFEQLFAEAQKLGLVFGTDAAQAAGKFNDALEKLQNSYRGFLVSLATSGVIDSAASLLNSLSENMGTLIKSAGLLATVVGGRLLQSFAQLIVSKGMALATTISVNAHLIKLAGVSSSAAIGLTAAATGASALSKGLALLGGPIGILATGVATVILFGDEIMAAADKIQVFGMSLGDIMRGAANVGITAFEGLLKSATGVAMAMVEVYKTAIARIEVAFRTMGNLLTDNAIGRRMGIDVAAPDRATMERAMRGPLQDMSTGFQSGWNMVNLPRVGQDEAGETTEQRQIKETIDLKGQDIKLTEAQIAAEERRKKAVKDLGLTFTSAFEEAVSSGKKLSEVLNALLADIMKIMLRMTVTEPLVGGLRGVFEGFGSSLFGGATGAASIPSHATGSKYVPRDMTARIHRGEMIIPASQVSKMGGGGAVSVVINNNSSSSVSTSANETANGMELTVMIDQAVAENISKPGSRTSQALGNFNSRRIIKR